MAGGSRFERRVTERAKLQPFLHIKLMHHQADTGAVSELQLTTDLLGTTPSVRHAAEVARRAAKSDDSILIVAESGFSPERLARAIHEAGPRASHPFLAIDCGDSHMQSR